MNNFEVATIYIRSLVAIPALAAIAMYGMYLQQMSDDVLKIIVIGIVSCVLMEVWKEAQAAKTGA
jgi:hypothetical protein